MVQIMVDLETFSSEPNAAICAIGAVAFELDGPRPAHPDDEPKVGVPHHKFYRNVRWNDYKPHGLDVSESTVMWWLSQSDEARKALTDPEPVALWKALLDLNMWMDQWPIEERYLWSHATFDAPILSHAYTVVRLKQPWKYNMARDLRTIQDLAFGKERLPNIPDEGKHNALWDAYRQAIMVQECWKRLFQDRSIFGDNRSATEQLGDPSMPGYTMSDDQDMLGYRSGR